MARFETFDRDIKLATAGLEPDAINAMLAKFAREELAAVISSGEGSAEYDRFVNGQAGVPEESVQAPGPILYVFRWWKDFIEAALAELQARSPRVSGRYASSFIVLVNQKLATNFDDIPANAEIIITNFQPYVRKIEVGAMKMSVPPRIFDQARRTLNRRFGNSFRVESTFLNVGSGVHEGMPYILKGEYARLRNARLKNPGRFSRSFPKRKDLEPGQPITYPSLVVNMIG